MKESDPDILVRTFKVTKIFRDFWHRQRVAAVRELDLEICEEEVFGLLGPNGSGKSTTIKMILGLLYPSRGYIRVFGRPPTDVAIKSRIGFLPEESYLYPFLNAWETLDYYGRLFRQARAERRRRIETLLDMVGLAKVAYRRVGEYSKGMQRRLGLAQALINDPDLLLLDEPTSGLDPRGTRQFKDLIRQLRRRGKTIIMCSHLLGDVEDVCDRVAVLYGGELRAVGKVDELLSQSDKTQITAPRLSDAALAKIRQIVAAETGGQEPQISVPQERLEALFLRVIADAQAGQAAGGAVETDEVAEFLRSSPWAPGKAVVDELVEATRTVAPAESESEPAPPKRPPAELDRDVLRSLTEGPPEGETDREKDA